MDAQERKIIDAFVRANLGTDLAEAERRVKSVNLTLEEWIYAWYQAGTQSRGEELRKEIWNRIWDAQTFDEWALVATSFSLAPHRRRAVEQLRNAPRPTEKGLDLLVRSKSRGLRDLAKELRAKLTPVQ